MWNPISIGILILVVYIFTSIFHKASPDPQHEFDDEESCSYSNNTLFCKRSPAEGTEKSTKKTTKPTKSPYHPAAIPGFTVTEGSAPCTDKTCCSTVNLERGKLDKFDGNCHLDDGSYGKWLTMKYPKIDEVYKIMKDAKVMSTLVVHFKSNKTEIAGFESWKEDFEKDHAQWDDFAKKAKYPIRLFTRTKTDTESLKKAVDAIHKEGLNVDTGMAGGDKEFKISLSPNRDKLPTGVELKYSSRCDGEEVKPTDSCPKWPKNDKLEFIVEFNLKNCDTKPDKPVYNLKFAISGVSYVAAVEYQKN